MRANIVAAVLVSAVLAACGQGSGGGGATADGTGAETPGAGGAEAASAGGGAQGAGPTAASTAALAGRTGVLSAPTDDQMVALFYSVSGVTPPIDNWVENEVAYSRNIDKTQDRELARENITALLNSVNSVGALEVEFAGQLSDYDPQYREFVIPALGGSTFLTFRGIRQREGVRLRFRNGRTANVWSVPPDQVQSVTDKLRGRRDLRILATLQIIGATPTPGDYSGVGVIDANIVEYDIIAESTGLKLGHVVAGQ